MQQAGHAKRKHRHPPGYTPEAKTADELNVSIHALRKWRRLRIGPPYIKVGRLIYYGDESRAAWLKSQEVQPMRVDQ